MTSGGLPTIRFIAGITCWLSEDERWIIGAAVATGPFGEGSLWLSNHFDGSRIHG